MLKKFFEDQALTASLIYDGNVQESFITYPWYDDTAEPGLMEPPDADVFHWLADSYKSQLNDTELSEDFHGRYTIKEWLHMIVGKSLINLNSTKFNCS